MKTGHDDDKTNHPSGSGDSTQVPGLDCLANVDVPLNGKSQGAPDAGIVEHLWQGLHKHLKCVAWGPAPVHVQIAETMLLEISFEQKNESWLTG